jgi:GTP-binding protein
MSLGAQEKIRNVAIVAHVDHGKTTLIDAMLKDSKVFRENQHVNEQIMDSNPQERERGITILAKNTAIQYGDITLNIIDTPGHADFSGEVERVVNMADGCLLVVDALDGPMPQTRYVLKVALASGLKPLVVINKIDRSIDQIDQTIESINDLFLDLATDAEQLSFPIIFASGKEGYSVEHLIDEKVNMTPLFESIIKHIPPPIADPDGGLQILVTSLDYDNHLGHIAIGRVARGLVKRGDSLVVLGENNTESPFKADRLFSFRDLTRTEINEMTAGNICAISGMKDISIGDTIAAADCLESLERINIEEPTVKMSFAVNTSPFSGKDGKYATSRMLWDRLQRELQKNVSLRVERTDMADEFIVSGRGELHLSVLIEDMRREGLEFQVSKPEAVTKLVEGKLYEPYEKITIETPQEYVGSLAEELSSRLGQLLDMQNDRTENMRMVYEMPTRGLIGFRSFVLRATRGSAVVNAELLESRPIKGMVKMTRFGSIVASETGTALTYGIKNAQERGHTFVPPNTSVYQGMIVGVHNRDGDMDLNICKERKTTNHRSATSEVFERLEPPMQFSLEEALDFVASDELAEITPLMIRLRKRILEPGQRHRFARK